MSRSSSARASSSTIMWRYLGSKMCKHWDAPGSITQLGNGKIGTSLSAKGILHSSHCHTLDVEKLRRELLCDGRRCGCRCPRIGGLRPERRPATGGVGGASDSREHQQFRFDWQSRCAGRFRASGDKISQLNNTQEGVAKQTQFPQKNDSQFDRPIFMGYIFQT